MKITFYTTASGRAPVWDTLKELDKPQRARVLQGLSEIEQYGFETLKVQWRHIEGKLWEIKIAGYRIFYVCAESDEIVLLHMYRKQGQKLPLKEKETALRRMKEVLA